MIFQKMSQLCNLPLLVSICKSTWFIRQKLNIVIKLSDRITAYMPRPYCVSKGLRKNLKFVLGGFCLLVKVFLEFKSGLGFFLPFPEHEIPKLA